MYENKDNLFTLKSHLDHGVLIIVRTFMEKKKLNNMVDTQYKVTD